MPINLANQIKNIRSKVNLSQDRFGKKIGVTGKAVSAYETGRTVPSLKVLDAISRTYNISLVNINDDKKLDMNNKLRLIQEYLNEVKEILTL
ncbi:MAG TPA: helix-turn-helix transcriptional regulator [Candidatus Saccharimonadales bacterium]|nr:helix-turn-helix transcriptional regulator [Candidatus Saccharimonadales bacterium]